MFMFVLIVKQARGKPVDENSRFPVWLHNALEWCNV